MVIRSHPERTRKRVRLLEEYVRSELLSADGSFVCGSYAKCRASRAGFPFHKGQMNHVGPHYDLEIDGCAMRIVVLGQEYGQALDCVDLAARSAMLAESARVGFRGRNPHMKGVTSTLRLLLGREPGEDEEGERLFDGHVFDGCAQVNYLLCTALERPRSRDAHGGGRGHSSTEMQRNCAPHFLRTMEILQPTVIVVHGLGLRRWMTNALPLPADAKSAETAEIAGHRVDLLTFTHPSAGGHSGWWGTTPRTRYLRETVAPAIRDYLRRRRAQG